MPSDDFKIVIFMFLFHLFHSCVNRCMHQAADVFTEDIELDVYNGTFLDLTEIGVVARVGNDGHFE